MAVDEAAPSRKNRAFGILMTGSSISMFGSRISTVAFPMLVLNLSGSPLIAGLVAFASIAPGMLVYIPVGALVDRWRPGWVLLVSESGRGIAVAAVVVALAFHCHLSIYLLILAMFAEEILEIFSTLAERRYTGLVTKDDASRAQAYIEVRAHAVMLTGRPFGAFLFKLAPILPFAADSLSFLVSVASLILIRFKSVITEPPRITRAKPLRRDMGEAIGWFRRDKYALVTIALLAGTTLIAQALILIFLAEAHEQDLSSLSIGTVLAASGAGGALGSMATTRLPAWIKEFWLQIQMVVWLIALGGLAFWGGYSFLWIASAMTALGLTGAVGNVEFGTYLVENVPNEMLARVTSVGAVLAIGASAIGPVLGGLCMRAHDVRSAVLWLLLIVLVLAIGSFSAVGLRTDLLTRLTNFSSSLAEFRILVIAAIAGGCLPLWLHGYSPCAVSKEPEEICWGLDLNYEGSRLRSTSSGVEWTVAPGTAQDLQPVTM